MPRLIAIDPSLEKQITHKKCGAVIGYYQSDIKSVTGKDFRGDSETYKFIICPNCGEEINV